MAVQNITYDDKTALNSNNDIPNINKVTDNDMNEIKSVVNNNATELTNLPGTIIESGSNANGNYVKFTDGTLICYKNVSITANINNEWGSLYENGTAVGLGSWAEAFYTTPSISVQVANGSGMMIQLINNVTTTSCGSIYFASATSGSKSTYLSIIGVGKWK